MARPSIATATATEIVAANYDIVVGVPASPQPTRAKPGPFGYGGYQPVRVLLDPCATDPQTAATTAETIVANQNAVVVGVSASPQLTLARFALTCRILHILHME